MTKKELKEPDEILSFLQKCSRFVSRYRYHVAGALVAFFLAVGVVYGYVTYQRVTESRENAKLWDLVSSLPEKAYSLTENDYQKLVMLKSHLEDFEKEVSTPTVLLYVKYYIADIDYRLGYYNQAAEKYREVLEKAGEVSELRYLCHLGLGYSLEALGKYAEAHEHFRRAEEAALDSYNRAVAAVGAARTLEEQGKKAEARALYEKVVKEYPDFPEKGFIEVHLATLS